MAEKSKLKIIIWGYDINSTEQATKAITQQIVQIKKTFRGPIPLPTKRELITVPISPHKHKDSQEQFERRIHRRLIEIFDVKKYDLVALNKVILPRTTYVKVKEELVS